jgi:ABC-type phosphate transport system substrate-binding protein
MRRTSIAFLSVVGILLGAGISHAQEIMIIANPAAPVSEISRDQLRDIFIGARTRFGNGSRAVPVLLKGGPVHEVFLSRIVGDNPDEFRVRWRRAVFTGQGAMPKEFLSEAAVLDYVATTPGAIGYVSRVSDPNAVKVLMVSTKK